MPLILNIETATRNCSVALADDGQVIASRDFASDGYAHAEKLHIFIGEVLSENALSFGTLDAIAVGKGPGSYTGLRVGVSSAKGLCYALDIPLIAIDTLAILAKQVPISGGLIVPMIDARRMEVYSAIFDARHQQIGPTQAEILSADSYSQYEQPLYFIGDCQEKVKTVLHRPNCHFLPDAVFPSARHMAAISHEKFLADAFEDVAYFEPFYLKDFVAGKPQG